MRKQNLVISAEMGGAESGLCKGGDYKKQTKELKKCSSWCCSVIAQIHVPENKSLSTV